MSDADDGATEQSSQEVAGDFRALLEKLNTRYNFDVREYKDASLARRIRARMAQVHVDSFAAYSDFLDRNPSEHVALFNTILINVTKFFRDPDAWQILADDVIPQLVAEAEGRSLRMWSAGCSSGEEPYSIAMLLAEHLGEAANNYTVKIYGTDVDEEALTAARHATYRTDQLKDVPDRLVDRYFTRAGQLYRIRRDIRRWCIFGSHNLTQAPPLSHIDMLLCRNVLIYFTTELQDRLLTRFHYSIREQGFLFLGRSESLLARSRLFVPVDLKRRIFQRTPTISRQAAAVLPDATPAPMPASSPRIEPTPAARVQRALDALPAAVVVIDTTDTILSWNPAAEAMFDVPVSSALTRKFRELDVSYRVEGLRARIEDVKARHAPSRIEDVTFTRRGGDIVHAEVTITPLFEAHRLVGVLVYAIDATAHARLREQMSRITEQHATAIEELQSTNEELETTNEELQSTNEELETTNEELQSTNEELETTVEELQAVNSELGALNAEAEARSDELKRVDAYHLGLLNSMDQSIFVTDRASVVTTWNQACARMWGLPSEQAVGRDLGALPLGDMARLLRSAVDTVLKREIAADVSDVPYTLPGGEMRNATVRLIPLRDAVGAVTGVIGIVVSPQAAGTDAKRR